MSYTVLIDPDPLDLNAIHAMLATAYWCAGVRREVIETAFRNSLVAVAVDASGRTVACARVITDRATFAYLADVFVAEPHRRKGLAKRMVLALEAHPTLATVRKLVLATRDAHTVYTSLGFAPVKEGNWLEKRYPESRWCEPASAPATHP